MREGEILGPEVGTNLVVENCKEVEGIRTEKRPVDLVAQSADFDTDRGNLVVG